MLFITELESVDCAVWTESSYKTDVNDCRPTLPQETGKANKNVSDWNVQQSPGG
jgi:hypothetical protein